MKNSRFTFNQGKSYKNFQPYFTNAPNKLECSPWQAFPDLSRVSSWPYPRKLERRASNKHSSFFGPNVNYGPKKFCNTGPRSCYEAGHMQCTGLANCYFINSPFMVLASNIQNLVFQLINLFRLQGSLNERKGPELYTLYI